LKEEIRRINKLVAEGKISPDDAADLIDAFYASEREERGDEAGPTAPPSAGAAGASRDPFRSIVDQIEKLTKEGADAVDWKEFQKQAKEGARKGLDFLKSGIEDLSKGRVNIFGSMETKDVSLPLTITEGKLLKIENACGDVVVKGGSSTGSATAKARFKGTNLEDARKKAAEYTLIIEESEHQVLIRQPDVSGLFVDLDVHFEGSASVEVKAESGDIQVLETGKGCRISTRSGDLTLKGLDGPIEITSDSGDVTVEHCQTASLAIDNKSGVVKIADVKGNMNIKSGSGDISIRECSAKVVSVEAISGTVSVDLQEPVAGNVNIRTVNGDASVSVADGSDCRVTLATLRGEVLCDLELSEEAKTDHRITGKMGSGTGTLDVSAVTGDVRLGLRAHQTAPV
jgi:DUF4097 and DUF4098 domain-containing protein YvlB